MPKSQDNSSGGGKILTPSPPPTRRPSSDYTNAAFSSEETSDHFYEGLRPTADIERNQATTSGTKQDQETRFYENNGEEYS